MKRNIVTLQQKNGSSAVNAKRDGITNLIRSTLCKTVGNLVVRASDSRPGGIGSKPDATKYPPSTHGHSVIISNLSDVKRGMIVGTCLAGVSVSRTGNFLGVLKITGLRVMTAYANLDVVPVSDENCKEPRPATIQRCLVPCRRDCHVSHWSRWGPCSFINKKNFYEQKGKLRTPFLNMNK
ncbi:hypothetical protein TNCV_895011 [Trichonephila clavipes]|nr:hypothetical protein TNCV_895011 [Trichonephila clavipes]